LSGAYGRHQYDIVISGSGETVWVVIAMQVVMLIQSFEEAAMRTDITQAARGNHNHEGWDSGGLHARAILNSESVM
jgi:hypothetical protein